MPCYEYVFLKANSQDHGMGTAFWRPASVRRLSATMLSSRKFVIRSMPISDADSQCEKKTTFVMDEETLIILVQGHVCVYNLQHSDYDKNLVKDNCWKKMSG
jgi:hypothetical protein